MIYALVSGGSKGIGYAIAVALAKRNYNLILVARDETDLESAKIKLEAAYHIKVCVLAFDLSREASAEAVAAWCTENKVELKMLCNVTGMGGAKDFPELSLNDTRYMLRLNIESAVALTFHLLPLLRKNRPSWILNVSSMAGFAPMSIKNIYSASKSAVIFFSYSLRYQLKEDAVSVSCLCPGPVFTKPDIKKTTMEKMGRFGKLMAVPAENIGEIAVRKTLKKKLLIIPGVLPSVISLFLRILPIRAISYMYFKLSQGK